jgi:Tol biopolymer transport system component
MSAKKPPASRRAKDAEPTTSLSGAPSAPQQKSTSPNWLAFAVVLIMSLGLMVMIFFWSTNQSSSTSAQAPAPLPLTATSTAVLQPLPPLVFVRQGNIWRSDGTANAPQVLTNLGTFAYGDQPAVSSVDGKIAFVRISAPANETSEAATVPMLTYALTVMNADGSEQRTVFEADGVEMALPYWTADGKTLLATTVTPLTTPDKYKRMTDMQGVRIPLDGGEPQVVVENAIGLTSTADGSALMYIRVPSPEGTPALMLTAGDGSNPRDILKDTNFSSLFVPRFSPDGARIVFAAAGGPETDAQGNPIALPSPSLLERALELLAPPSARAHGAPWGVWIVNQDGSGLRLLTTLYHGAPIASFSPDGTQIAVMDGSGIYLLQTDGSQVLQLDFQGDSGGLVWVR